MKLPATTKYHLTDRLALVILLVSASLGHRSGLHRASALSIDGHQAGHAQALDSVPAELPAQLAPKEPDAGPAGATSRGAPNYATVLQAPADSSKRHDSRRPIWALAHMVNSIKELDYRLRLGANAVEADVTFARDGVPKFTYHGPPCDCWRHCHQRENFDDYLAFIREESIEVADGLGQNLTLLFLDLKLDPLDQLAKARAGRELATSITGSLYLAGQRHWARAQSFHLILSINHAADIELVRNFVHALEQANAGHLLEKNIGFDVGMNDDLHQIEAMWRKFAHTGTPLNLWQGDGYTNCLSPFYNLERLSRALSKRDAPQGYPAKVYHWTIDLRDRMRESLLMGVDGVMTNHPERLLAVLQEPDIAHEFRLATRHDNVFQKLPRRVLGRSGETARYQRSAQTYSNGFLGSLLDVLASWLNYVREIPLLSLPTTLMSKSANALRLQRRQAASKTTAANMSAPAASTTQVSGTATSSRATATATATTLSAPTTTTQRPAVLGTNVTQVKLSQQLEYKLENATTVTLEPPLAGDQQQRHAGSAEGGGPQAQADVLQNVTAQDTRPEYEGPKWYTSLISNMLVSAIKVVLPP